MCWELFKMLGQIGEQRKGPRHQGIHYPVKGRESGQQ